MKKVISALMLSGVLFTGSALASPIYYQAIDVEGTGTIDYGIGATIFDAPVFSFDGISGTVSENLASYTPGDYTVSFYLDGLMVDGNEDGDYLDLGVDFVQPSSFSFTSAPVTLPALSLAGSLGQLSWTFNPYSDITVSYDFGAFGNSVVNGKLKNYDPNHDGVMKANIKWDKLRVELHAVPEPATLLLFGVGLLGVGFKRRQMRS